MEQIESKLTVTETADSLEQTTAELAVPDPDEEKAKAFLAKHDEA